jgi:hypothetical protein
MAQENFNVSQPNDGLGDKLRAAFIKVQSNFTDLFNEKVDKEVGKGLSANDYTTTEKNKLANIEDFAELNVQADFLQNDNTQDDFIKNKPAIPVLDNYVLNGGYAGTAQDLDDAIEAAGQLVKVTENGKTGYRLKDADPANYGDIGLDAVDLSFQIEENTTKGATGNNSHAEGFSTTASGQSSHAEGIDTTASGQASHAEGELTVASGQVSRASGTETVASGNFSDASGNSTTASGDVSKSSGFGTFARSLAEFCGGIFPTDYTPQSATDFDLTDRLVNYGNGVNISNRSDAYTLFKNGMQKFFTAALSTITNAVKGSVMLDENARLNIHDGSAFKAVAFSDEVKSLKNDIVKGASYFNDFDGSTANGINDGTFLFQAAGGGFLSQGTDAAFEEDDILILRCSSANNSIARIFNQSNTSAEFKNIAYMIKSLVLNLATAANKYSFLFGRSTSNSIINSTSSFGFLYDKAGDYLGTASDNWLAVTKSGANSTIIDTGIAVIDSAYVRLMIKYTPTSITYFINGVLVATITTNIFTGTANDILAIQKTAAGTINQDVLVDYYSRVQTKITPRIYDN